MSQRQATVDEDATHELADQLRGEVLLAEDGGYDDAREVWNAMIDRHPAVIVQPAGAADVMETIPFAREHDLDIAIKGGGHNVAGNAVVDDGLMLDCSRMDAVHVDPDQQIARVGPGTTLHDLDVESQAHGLVTPAGFISTTGAPA